MSKDKHKDRLPPHFTRQALQLSYKVTLPWSVELPCPFCFIGVPNVCITCQCVPEKCSYGTAEDKNMVDHTHGKWLMDFYIPTYIFVPKAERSDVTSKDPPSCPVIVFVNSKSGGQLGGELLLTYTSILNKNQVFDLGVNAPAKVLHTLYANLEQLKKEGDSYASAIYKRLRIIVAGGDGTASWILGVISDLKLPHAPPVASVPLGTGNNLPFSFGWGKKNPGTDQRSVEAFLGHVKTAKEMKIDSWHMRLKIPKQGSRDSVAPLELPNSLHAVRGISKSDAGDNEKYQIFQGGFWNYFSMGMDAKVSYAFHAERKLHPEKFKNQISNQGTYFKLGCKEGGFSSSLISSPSSCNIAQQTKIKIMKRNSQHWEELLVPSSIRSIICLNLPSFSGGFNPWGKPTRKKYLDMGFTSPYVDDGLIEVVGFRDAWHGLVLLAPLGHGTRLAQANRIRFEFDRGSADHTYMRMDGEPWKQPLPSNSKHIVIEISHLGQVNMLYRPPCRSRSVNDPSAPYNSPRSGEDGSDDDDDWEERRKMGAADSFKVPDEIEVEISQLS